METTKTGASGGAPPPNVLEAKDTDLIKKIFKDDENRLLKTVRALFFGIKLLDDEKAHIKSVFSDVELRDLMRRRFLPNIKESRELPLGQIQDVWLGAEQMVFGATAIQIEQAIRYKEKAEELTKHALVLLENPDGMAVPYGRSSFATDPLQIDLMARNMYLRHVDQQLLMISLIANQKQETKKETEERRIRNSNR